MYLDLDLNLFVTKEESAFVAKAKVSIGFLSVFFSARGRASESLFPFKPLLFILQSLFASPASSGSPPGFSLDLDPVLDLFHSFCIGMLICLSADPTFLYIVLPWIAQNS